MAGSDEYYYVARLSGAVRRDGCWPALFVTPSADYAESWYASSAGIAWHNCALEQSAVPGEVAAVLSNAEVELEAIAEMEAQAESEAPVELEVDSPIASSRPTA